MDANILVYCATSVVGTVALIFAVQRLLKKIKEPRPPKLTKDYPKDTVLLHQFSISKYAPSLSPFPLKLETYFRMAKIPYRNIHNAAMGGKGKIPWIEYNGVAIDDSQFCLEYLNDKCNIDLDKHLSPEQKAVSRALLKLVEESLYWSLVWWRWNYQKGQDLIKLSNGAFSPLLVRFIMLTATKQTFMQGMGRHSKDEIIHITRCDVAALSHYLGKKPFLMGDKASEIDCAAFGMLAQLLWQMTDSPHTKMVTDEFPNLRDYCHRIRDTYWPDWDQCILEPGSISSKKND